MRLLEDAMVAATLILLELVGMGTEEERDGWPGMKQGTSSLW